jgi:hypothetical protein
MQLKYTSLLLMAFLAIASAQTFGQEKDLLSAEYSKCIEQSGGTDPGMLDCMGAEAERQDKRLNDVYKKLMKFCFWHKADILNALTNVRFRGKADIDQALSDHGGENPGKRWEG